MSLEFVSSAYLRLQKQSVTKEMLHTLSTPSCDLTNGTTITISLDGINTSIITFDLTYEDLQGNFVPPIKILDLLDDLETDNISDALMLKVLLQLDESCHSISLDSLGLLTSTPVLSVYTDRDAAGKPQSLFDFFDIDITAVHRVKRTESPKPCSLQKLNVSYAHDA